MPEVQYRIAISRHLAMTCAPWVPGGFGAVGLVNI